MASILRLALLPTFATSLPHNPELIDVIMKADTSNEQGFCFAKECHKPDRKYELLFNTQPGVQWMKFGGYCGAWSIQRSAMAKGAWISEQQVRDHAKPGGGNDEEILSPNIDDALKALKIKADGWDYANQPTPQVDAYLKWLKKKLVSGHAVVWMIMQPGENVPITDAPYKNQTYVNGLYGHIEPVVGIMSNHPFTDETVYDDDVVVHYTDADKNTYYRTMKSLPGDWSESNPTPVCQVDDYAGCPCINKQRGYGWAIEGFLDSQPVAPLSLTVDHFGGEPSPRSGQKAIQMTGTLTATGLTKGAQYEIYRWGSVDEAFNYTDDHRIKTFTATDESFVYTDPKTFSSFSATYYRCKKAAGESVVV